MNNLKLLFDYCASNDITNLSKNIKTLHDINVKDKDTGWTLLSVSAFHHSYDCVDLLLSKGANINTVSKNGTSIIMYAKTKVYVNRNFQFLDYLISKGADLFIKDKFNKNVLEYIEELGDSEMISYFRNRMLA